MMHMKEPVCISITVDIRIGESTLMIPSVVWLALDS